MMNYQIFNPLIGMRGAVSQTNNRKSESKMYNQYIIEIVLWQYCVLAVLFCGSLCAVLLRLFSEIQLFTVHSITVLLPRLFIIP